MWKIYGLSFDTKKDLLRLSPGGWKCNGNIALQYLIWNECKILEQNYKGNHDDSFTPKQNGECTIVSLIVQ